MTGTSYRKKKNKKKKTRCERTWRRFEIGSPSCLHMNQSTVPAPMTSCRLALNNREMSDFFRFNGFFFFFFSKRTPRIRTVADHDDTNFFAHNQAIETNEQKTEKFQNDPSQS
jgi:hypothetical protein